jgi:hypothetical protein
MLHEARLGVEELVVAAVPLAALGLAKHLNRHPSTCRSVATLTVPIQP